MKNSRKISSTMTGAVLSLTAAVAFLFTGIALLCFGFGLFAIAPFLVCAVFAVNAVCRFKSATDKTGKNVNDEAEDPPIQNGSTFWKLRKMKKGICPFCGAALKVTNGAGMVYCAHCGRRL